MKRGRKGLVFGPGTEVCINSVEAFRPLPHICSLAVHSREKKQRNQQSMTFPKWYDCRHTVFIFSFSDLYAYRIQFTSTDGNLVFAGGSGVLRQGPSIIHTHLKEGW